METVAGEKPLDFATSRIVIVTFFPLCRFTAMGSSADIIILLSLPNMQWALSGKSDHSAGTSNESWWRQTPVFQAPNAMPSIIQMPPRIFAGTLRPHHSPRQMKNPKIGGKKFDSFFSGSRTKECKKGGGV